MKKLLVISLLSTCVAMSFGDYAAHLTGEARVEGSSTVSNTTTTVFVAEGTNAGTSNEQYSIASFSASSFGIPTAVGSVSSATLDLTDGGNSFQVGGSFSLYFDTNNTTALGSYVYNTSNPPSGFGSDISGNLINAGTFTYVPGASGTADNYALTLSAAGQSYLVNQLNSNGNILVVLGANDAAVATTFEGIGKTASPVLDLNVTAAPEPITMLGLAPIAIAALRRRKRA